MAKSETDSKFLDLSKQYNTAYRQKDVVIGKLEPLLAEDVRYHADQVTLQDDIEGKKEVLKYIQAYFDKYDYNQVVCFGAVNPDEKLAFNLVVDKDVKPKPGSQKEQHDRGEVKPSNTIAITALIFDKNDQISNIFPARQLSYDEAYRKLKKVPDYAGSSFNPEQIKDDQAPESSEERRQLLKSLAQDWSTVFTKNDVALADKISSPDIKVHNLLVSEETKGLDAWKKSLAEVFKEWEHKDSRIRIAVTAGDKAFVLWETKGAFKGRETNVWGITFLRVDEKTIDEAAVIHGPFPGEREALVKAAT